MDLTKTPPVHREMPIGLSHAGATRLKDNRFRQRWGGSTSLNVRINGIGTEAKSLSKPKVEGTPVKKRDPLYGIPKGLEWLLDTFTKKEPVKKLYGINRGKLRNRIYAFCAAQEKKHLYFITVTFPPSVTDNLAYQALNTWLTVCRQSLGLTNYVWVAERQKIGTIHYHLLIPHYFNIQKANRAMQTVLRSFCNKKKLGLTRQQVNKYNGVDIAKNRNTKRVVNFNTRDGQKALAKYVTKYVTKNNEKFTHYAWHCSRDFSAVFTKIALTLEESKKIFVRYHLDPRRKKESEYFTYIPWIGNPPWFFYDLLNLYNFEIVNKKKLDPEKIPRGLFPFIGLNYN